MSGSISRMASNLAIATRRLGGPGGDSYAERVISNLEVDTLLARQQELFFRMHYSIQIKIILFVYRIPGLTSFVTLQSLFLLDCVAHLLYVCLRPK